MSTYRIHYSHTPLLHHLFVQSSIADTRNCRLSNLKFLPLAVRCDRTQIRNRVLFARKSALLQTRSLISEFHNMSSNDQIMPTTSCNCSLYKIVSVEIKISIKSDRQLRIVSETSFQSDSHLSTLLNINLRSQQTRQLV